MNALSFKYMRRSVMLMDPSVRHLNTKCKLLRDKKIFLKVTIKQQAYCRDIGHTGIKKLLSAFPANSAVLSDWRQAQPA